MRPLTNYAPKAVAMLCAVALTASMLVLHAVDRTHLGAPAAPLHSTYAHSPATTPAASPRVAEVTVTLIATRHD